MVRPIFEYASPVWSPYLKKDIQIVENVQRRTTKLIKNISHLSYHERLLNLGLPTLKYRRDRQDLIEVYKIMFSQDGAFDMFTPHTLSFLRGNNRKLFKHHSRTNIRLNSF